MDLLQIHSFSLHKMLTDGLDFLLITVMFSSAVWTQLFLSAVFDWWASDVMLNFSKSVLIKKKKEEGKPESFQHIFIFHILGNNNNK